MYFCFGYWGGYVASPPNKNLSTTCPGVFWPTQDVSDFFIQNEGARMTPLSYLRGFFDLALNISGGGLWRTSVKINLITLSRRIVWVFDFPSDSFIHSQDWPLVQSRFTVWSTGSQLTRRSWFTHVIKQKFSLMVPTLTPADYPMWNHNYKQAIKFATFTTQNKNDITCVWNYQKFPSWSMWWHMNEICCNRQSTDW